jgi:hypothetical protein
MDIGGKNNPLKKWGPIIVILAPLASLVNFFFGGIARSVLSKQIKKAEGFNLRIKHLSISLFSSSIQVTNFLLYENNTIANKENILSSANSIKIQLDRKALWNGEIKAQIVIVSPFIEIIKGGILAKHTSQLGNLSIDIPITIDRLTISGGKLQYKDATTNPPVNICTDCMDLTASGLSTFNELHTQLPGEIELKGAAYDGFYKINIKTDMAVIPPMFDANAEVRLINMPKLNNIFQAYAGFDVQRGSFSVFVEAASADGRFTGYVKPVIENLEIVGPQDVHTGFWHIAKEKLMGMVAALIENEKNKEIATKLSFEGTYQHPHIHIATAIVEVLRNAFVCALKPKIDHEISLGETANIRK